MRDYLTAERLLRRIEWANGILIVVATLGAWVLFSGAIAFGVFQGCVIATLSFQILKWQLKKAFRNPDKIPQKASLFASYYLRFLGTLFVVFTVIYYGWANPIALLVGLSVVVLSIVLVGGQEFLVMLAKKGED